MEQSELIEPLEAAKEKMMETYIAFAFWSGCFVVFMKSIFLVGKHPRIVEHSVGEDAFGLIIGIVLLVWVAALKYSIGG